MASKQEEPKSLFAATLQDVNGLLDQMQANGKGPTFANLAKVWREMRFARIFKRSNPEEIIEFIPVTFLAVKVNMMPPVEMERRLYALQLLYGLFVKQPCENACKIRLTCKEWNNVLELFRHCAAHDFKEQCYIIEKLWSLSAFDFVYSPVDLSLFLSSNKELGDLEIVATEGIEQQTQLPEPPSVVVSQKIEQTNLKEKQDAYNELVQDIEGFSVCSLTSRLDALLNREPLRKKANTYQKLLNKNRQPEPAKETVEPELDIGLRRRKLIDRRLGESLQEAEAPPTPEKRSEARVDRVDPEYAFIYAGGHKSLLKSMRQKFVSSLKAKPGDVEEVEVMELDEEMEQDEESEPQPEVSSAVETSTEPIDEEQVLQAALSMPVVEWHDPE